MAKAKYKKTSRGLYETSIWDGTYNKYGQKHYKHLTDKTASGLQKKVEALEQSVKEDSATVFSDYLFQEYAYHWLEVSKATKEKNTQAMYLNVIKVHFDFLADVRVVDIRHSHFQQAINHQIEHPRTCQNIDITFKQVIKSAIRDRILPKSAYDDI